MENVHCQQDEGDGASLMGAAVGVSEAGRAHKCHARHMEMRAVAKKEEK